MLLDAKLVRRHSDITKTHQIQQLSDPHYGHETTNCEFLWLDHFLVLDLRVAGMLLQTYRLVVATHRLV